MSSIMSTPSRKRGFDSEFDSPQSVATPPPESPESPSPLTKVRRIDRSGISPIPGPDFSLGSPTNVKENKAPGERSYSHGSSTSSPPPFDVFSSPSLGSIRTQRQRIQKTTSEPLIRVAPSNSEYPVAGSSRAGPDSFVQQVSLDKANPNLNEAMGSDSRTEAALHGQEYSQGPLSPSKATGTSHPGSQHQISVDQPILQLGSAIYTVSHPLPIIPSPPPKQMPNIAIASIELGVKLPVVHVAHNRRIQDLMERRELSWGVQLQIARGITQGIWTWEEISPEALDKLKGPAALAAPKVKEVICQSVGRSANDDVDISVWYAEYLL
jgi:hypothetical protein